uniref:Uncharacterized protein n=1 Tax=Daphnia magna TaxID=35525 RepID=A0A0P5T6L1_9CRUS
MIKKCGISPVGILKKLLHCDPCTVIFRPSSDCFSRVSSSDVLLINRYQGYRKIRVNT